MWLDTFNQMRKNSGLSLDEISAMSGVPKGTLSKITSGITKAPSLETMRSLVYSMGYTLDDLDDGLNKSTLFSRDEQEHIKLYRALDAYGQEAVSEILSIEYRRCMANAKSMDATPNYSSMPFAAYGEVPEEYSDDQKADIEMFSRMIAERKRKRAEKAQGGPED